MSLLDRYFIKKPAVREAVTRALYGDKDVSVCLMGDQLTINTLKENGYFRASKACKNYSVFRDEAIVLQNIASLIRDGSTFIDVGANIGLFSSAIARVAKLKHEVDVIAFEVDPDTFQRLSQNAEQHGFRAKNVGLSNIRGSKTFVRGAVSHVTTVLEKKNSYNMARRTFDGQLLPLDDLDLGDKPKFIKIDVEGAELEVLEGAKKLLERNEIYGIYFDGLDQYSEAKAMLTSYGFSFFNGRTLEPSSTNTFSILALLDA